MLTFNKLFNFNPDEYTEDGWKKVDSAYPLFYYIDECQMQFYEEYTPYVANVLFVNSSMAFMLHKCYQFAEDEILGMDLINGEIDFEANSQMEKNGNKQLIFGIGCAVPGHEDDQPVLVVLDDKLNSGEFRLSYYQDYDKDEDDYDEDNADPIPDDVLELDRVRVNSKI